ncbi:MAG: GGDEF domain-containing protein [Actinomycetales bacterium]|nr:GGDEF domain-containing protein [Actinomycetales bacterium]
MTKISARHVVVVMTGVGSYQIPMLRSMREVFSRHGISLIAHTTDPFAPGIPVSLQRLLREGMADGVVMTNCLVGDEEDELVEMLAALGVPSAFIGLRVSGATSVYGDNLVGMRELMAHLLDDRGVRRPVLLRGIRHQPDTVQREVVFREELARRGVPVDEGLVVDGEYQHDVSFAAVRDLLARRQDLDAVVAMNDMSALGALEALADGGLRVPEDVLVTGFDDDPAASLTWPGLTSVDQGLAEQGAAAATGLVAQLAGRPPSGEVVVPTRLVVRGSTAAGENEEACRVDSALEMAREAHGRIIARDAVLGISRAMIRCRTVDQVVEAFTSRLNRLGLLRCFLVAYAGPDPAGGTGAPRHQRARLLLDHREGRAWPLTADTFSSSELLPAELRGELDRGLLVMQPLSVVDRELGYMLFEQHLGSVEITDVLRIDLSRTLDSALGTQELADHAATLERLVIRRTRELEAEVVTRRRAERELQRANGELQRMLMHDSLTRIANRVAFARHLERQWRALADRGGELAVVMVDVDLFKAYNDHNGHVVGDEALRAVASCLERAVRAPEDLACRYGGEEFAVVLPDSDVTEALAVADRFRDLLAEASIPHGASPVASVVTASIGVAVTVATPEGDPSSVVEAADAALYRAKASGRNQVFVAAREDRPRRITLPDASGGPGGGKVRIGDLPAGTKPSSRTDP